MQSPFDNIVQHLFHQPSLLSVTVNELERMAEQHPYFAAAHFLLLKKMQDTDHPQFNSQLHKTTLYFNNPLWLQFLLQPEKLQHLPVLDKAPFLSNEQAANTETADGNDVTADTNIMPVENEPADNQVQVIQHEEINTDTNIPHAPTGIMEVITEVFHDPQDGVDATRSAEEATAISQQEITDLATQTEAAPVQENIAILPANALAEEIPVVDETVPEQFSTEVGPNYNGDAVHYDEPSTQHGEEQSTKDLTAGSNLNEVEEQSPAEHISTDAEETTDAAINTDHADALHVATPALAEAVAGNTANDISEPATTTEQADETAFAATGQFIATGAEKPLLKIVETPAAQDDRLFEPYHTVDYFASQGIKLSKAETEEKDKLGRKLRSFTDWLKTMKKLPQASIENILSKNEESKVVEDATHSIENKEVITEAMAEVFEKQGMTDKALEVYQKLSLLNPAKSAYFAAKIEDLKH